MFKDDYKAAFSKVTASEETHRRILNMTKEHKKRRSVGGLMSKLLIAAVLVSLLTLTASAAVQNWFVTYFSKESKTPLIKKEKYIFERLCNLAPGCRKSNRAAKKRRQSRLIQQCCFSI